MLNSHKYRYQKYNSKMSNLINQIGGAPDIRVRLDNGTWVLAK